VRWLLPLFVVACYQKDIKMPLEVIGQTGAPIGAQNSSLVRSARSFSLDWFAYVLHDMFICHCSSAQETAETASQAMVMLTAPSAVELLGPLG
jgi:hypothetical protein